MSTEKPPVVVEVVCSDRLSQGSTVTDTVEVERDLWDGMTPAERFAYCDELANEEAYNRFSWGWHIYDQADMASTEEKA